MSVTREIEIEAAPEEVWEVIATDEGRESWLDEPDREVRVDVVDAPRRMVWWWWKDDLPATRVEIDLVPAVSGTRVVVTESAPATFPLTALRARFAPVAA